MKMLSIGTRDEFVKNIIQGFSVRVDSDVIAVDKTRNSLVRVCFDGNYYFYETLEDARDMLYSMGLKLPDETGGF
jgi:hypothetical protein